MNIDGAKIVVRVQRSRARANPNRHVVHVGKATYYFDVLDPQEAIEKAVAKYRGRQQAAVTAPTDGSAVAERIKNHPMYSASDLKHLRKKGYRDQEILAFWDRDHGLGCKPVHHMVAYSGRDVDVLRDVLRDNLGPQAIAVIAGHLHGMVNTKSDSVNREVAWFTEQLLDMVGDQYNALCEEAGL
jgi:hypothetical protein